MSTEETKTQPSWAAEIRVLALAVVLILVTYWAPKGMIFIGSGWLIAMATRDRVLSWTNGSKLRMLLITLFMTTAAILIPGPIAFIFWSELQATIAGVTKHSEALSEFMKAITGVVEKYAPSLLEEGTQNGTTSSLGTLLVGEAINNAQQVASFAGKTLLHLAAIYIEIIMWVIWVTFLYAKGAYFETHMFQVITAGSQRRPALGEWIIELYATFQEVLEHWVLGVFKVVSIFTVIYFVVYAFGPWGFTWTKALFLAITTGSITAIIMKVGGMASAVIAALLTASQFQMGFSWFGYDIGTTGSLFMDMGIRSGLIWIIIKGIGLLEPIVISPKIIGDVLGIPQPMMVGTVIATIVGSGLGLMFGGIVLMLLYWAHHVQYERKYGRDPINSAQRKLEEKLKIPPKKRKSDTPEVAA